MMGKHMWLRCSPNVLPDPPGDEVLPTAAVLQITYSAAEAFSTASHWSTMPDSWGNAYQFVCKHLKALVDSGAVFTTWNPPYGPDKPSPEGLHPEKVEWAWNHAKNFTEGAFLAASRFIEDSEARAHDQLLVVENTLEMLHAASKPTYDVSQEKLYQSAMEYVLSELRVETFESRDGADAYGVFIWGTVIGKPRPEPQGGPDIETALVAVGLVEGMRAAEDAIAQGGNLGSMTPDFVDWHQAIGGREMVKKLLQQLGRPSPQGCVLYHEVAPSTRVLHLLMIDRVLLQNPPSQDILPLDADHEELHKIMSCCLQAANDFADKHGEQLRSLDDISPAMRADYQRAFNHHFGSSRSNGQKFTNTIGVGMDGPDHWAFYGWTMTLAE